MTSSELVKNIAARLGKTQKEVAEFTKALAEEVHEKVAAGEKVVIKDIVTIDSKVVAAHTARNPQTNEPVEVAEKVAPVVKAVTALKTALNK
jgi:DNA-binding protein HU-beta